MFPAGASAISVNDIAGPTALRSIRFEEPHTIQGAGAISVETGIEVLANAAIQGPIQLLANAAITGIATLAISGAITAADFAITGVTVDATNTTNAFTGLMTINAGGTFVSSAQGALGAAVPPTVGVHLAGGTLKANGPFSGTMDVNRLTGDGTLELGDNFTTFTVWVATTNLFTGNITGGSAVFEKKGDGILTFGGPTAYDGLTYLSAGEIVIAHPQALATAGINVFSPTGSTLTFDVPSTRTRSLGLYGTGFNGMGALRLRGGSVTQMGITHVGDSTAKVVVPAPYQLVLEGEINFTGQTLTVIGDGSVVFRPTIAKTLSAVVLGGGVGPGPTLRGDINGALSNLGVTINAGATLDLGGFSTTFATISGTGRIETGGAGAVATLVTNNATFAGTFHGPGSARITDTTNTVTLAGTHTLAGTFYTDSPHLVVKGTIPAAVTATGAKVTLEPGSVTGPLTFLKNTATAGEIVAGDAINPGGATTGGLMLHGTFKPMLSGTAPRLTVNGAVTITGVLDLSYAGVIPPGVLTLIANDGVDPIVGIFNDVLDGGQLTLHGVKYVVDYHGGDGNDLTLTPPITTYHLSEGATGTFFDTDLLIANPWWFGINVEVTFLPENAAPLTLQYTLAPQSRRTIRVDQIAGMESAAFSTIVKPDIEFAIAVERTMRWDASGYGGHTEKATSGPATTWYFAEGSEGFFRTFLLLANPQTTPNVAHVTWLREGASPIERSYDLLPTSRKTIAALDDAALLNQAFGMTVTFDQPGVAERAMYFGGPPVFKGGHESAGVTEPSPTWLLAEGATGDGFDTFILVANPGSEEADVTFTFLPEQGAPATLTRKVNPRSRITVNPESEDLSIPLGPVATQVTATKPVIAERAQYWPLGPVQWTEAHNSFGVTEAALAWALAEGRVGGSDGYQTFILLANPGDTTANVELIYLK